MTQRHHVFLSYAHEDSEIMRRVCTEIEARDYDLKAVNPNAVIQTDNRTPEELINRGVVIIGHPQPHPDLASLGLPLHSMERGKSRTAQPSETG